MKARARAGAIALVTAAGAIGAVGTVAPASAQRSAPPSNPVKVITKGLDGPFGIDAIRHRSFLVAESVSGEVTRVGRHGRQARAHLRCRRGRRGRGRTAPRVTPSSAAPTRAAPPPPAASTPASSVLRSGLRGNHVKVIADLASTSSAQPRRPEAVRRRRAVRRPVQPVRDEPVALRPAGRRRRRQRRAPGQPEDRQGVDVLRPADRQGRPGAARRPDANANPGTVGCDPVPTGVEVRGTASTSARWVPRSREPDGSTSLNARTGKVLQRVWKGLDRADRHRGVADGTIYVSEVFHAAPETSSRPGFDPASVGPDHQDHARQDHPRAGDDADRVSTTGTGSSTPRPGASPLPGHPGTPGRSSGSIVARSTDPGAPAT